MSQDYSSNVVHDAQLELATIDFITTCNYNLFSMSPKRQLSELSPVERIGAVIAVFQSHSPNPIPRAEVFRLAKVNISKINKKTKRGIEDFLKPYVTLEHNGGSEHYLMPEEARVGEISRLNIDEPAILKGITAYMLEQWQEFKEGMPTNPAFRRKL